MLGLLRVKGSCDLHLCDLTAFVVATEDGDSVGVAHLEGDEKSDSLDRVVATIDVVTHEEIIGVGRLATNLEEFAQIVELTVNVTADGHWCTHLLHVGLVDQDFFSLCSRRSIS